MSAKLMSAVYDSALERAEKSVLVAVAYYADDDGGKVYPSVGLIAWRTDYTERQIRRYLRSFEERGFLIRESSGDGGRGKTTRYRLDVRALPERPQFGDENPDTIMSPFKEEEQAVNPDISRSNPDTAMSPFNKPGHSLNPDISDTKPGHSELNPDILTPKGGHSYVRGIVKTSHLEQSIEQSSGEQAKTKKKKPMPDNGPAQHLVKVWAELTGVAPSNYGKSVKAAQSLVNAGADDAELCQLYEYMRSSDYWSERGFDLMNAFGQLDKCRMKRRTPSSPNGKQSILDKNMRNLDEAYRMTNGNHAKAEDETIYETTGEVK